MTTYFELFDLPSVFILDLKQLAAYYRELQCVVHPDRFASATDSEKKAALVYTVRINDAYQTLKDPVRRAVYLLSLKHINAMDEQNTAMPAAFLMQQIEWREALEHARILQNEAHIEAMRTELDNMLTSLGDTFAAAYEGGHLETATTLARKMRFVQKLNEEVENALTEIDT